MKIARIDVVSNSQHKNANRACKSADFIVEYSMLLSDTRNA